jgi:putative transposase
MALAEGHAHTMALDQSALLEVLEMLKPSLFSVIMEAYLHGTPTRKVDDLVKALGADSGISKSDPTLIRLG